MLEGESRTVEATLNRVLVSRNYLRSLMSNYGTLAHNTAQHAPGFRVPFIVFWMDAES